MLSRLLYKLYGSRRRRLRNFVLDLVTKLEGGEMLSPTLRRIFLEYHDVEIGMYSYGSCFVPMCFGAHTKIGRYCSFAGGVYRFNANHPLDRISTHAIFYNPKVGYAKKEADIKRRGMTIGNDVWVSQNVILLPSVKRIGDGAVIGAGAVVTKDVPDFAIVVGNPAKVIKYRFSKEIQLKIKASKWWDKDIRDLDLDKFAVPVENGEGVELNKLSLRR
jgi:acetyltransferase-like isoleucine patch superfamily enzyme